MVAINSPGDHMFCHRQSGGTTFRGDGDQLKYDRSQM